MTGFGNWLKTNSERYPVTIFVIADQLMDEYFRDWLIAIVNQYPSVTIGCHGYEHRSWSAWPEDKDNFSQALEKSKKKVLSVVGNAWRPWFRAPNGYIAPWMAEVLKEQGFTLDTSINPSLLVRRKAGKKKSWKLVNQSMKNEGIIERQWLTSWLGPTCGPALHIPGLRGIARRLWLQKSALPIASEKQLLDEKQQVITLYWHLLDHGKNNGTWCPPLNYCR